MTQREPGRLRGARGKATVHREDVMLITCLRLALLLAMLVASLHVAAEPRVWTLTDVRIQRFNPNAPSNPTDPVTGYFVYDDATGTISNWSVRFPVPFFDFPSFTYVPGNSLTYVFHAPPRQPFLVSPP
jgi:hypothetical protein